MPRTLLIWNTCNSATQRLDLIMPRTNRSAVTQTAPVMLQHLPCSQHIHSLWTPRWLEWAVTVTPAFFLGFPNQRTLTSILYPELIWVITALTVCVSSGQVTSLKWRARDSFGFIKLFHFIPSPRFLSPRGDLPMEGFLSVWDPCWRLMNLTVGKIKIKVE